MGKDYLIFIAVTLILLGVLSCAPKGVNVNVQPPASNQSGTEINVTQGSDGVENISVTPPEVPITVNTPEGSIS
jgi:hypothetical protein